MLDFDIAEMYEVETRALNQAVKRNMDIFPKDFMFQLSKKEWDLLLTVTERTGVRRDSFIANAIHGELGGIANVKPLNKADKQSVLQKYRSQYHLIRVNIKIPEKDIRLLNFICKDKNIPRSIMMNLILGFINVRCAVPFVKLNQPRKCCNKSEWDLLMTLSNHSDFINDYINFLSDFEDKSWLFHDGDPYTDHSFYDNYLTKLNALSESDITLLTLDEILNYSNNNGDVK